MWPLQQWSSWFAYGWLQLRTYSLEHIAGCSLQSSDQCQVVWTVPGIGGPEQYHITRLCVGPSWTVTGKSPRSQEHCLPLLIERKGNVYFSVNLKIYESDCSIRMEHQSWNIKWRIFSWFFLIPLPFFPVKSIFLLLCVGLTSQVLGTDSVGNV